MNFLEMIFIILTWFFFYFTFHSYNFYYSILTFFINPFQTLLDSFSCVIYKIFEVVISPYYFLTFCNIFLLLLHSISLSLLILKLLNSNNSSSYFFNYSSLNFFLIFFCLLCLFYHNFNFFILLRLDFYSIFLFSISLLLMILLTALFNFYL